MKKINLSLVILAFYFTAFSVHANPEQICEDLHKLACAPGTYDDGTGTASNTSFLVNKSADIGKKMIEKSQNEFAKVLSNPDNVYFRRSVLSATGLSENPVCQGSDKKPNAECLALMSEGAADILAKQQFAQSGMVFPGMIGGQSSVSDTTYVTDSPIFKKIQEDLMAQIRTNLNEPAVDKKVREVVFPRVKTMLLGKISSMIADPKLRDALTEKIKAIQYVGSDCSKDLGSENKIPGVLVSNAFYNPTQNTFKYCLGMGVQNDSEYKLAFVIAHELSHSIDPCGISRGPSDYAFKYKSITDRAKAESEFPFPGILGCLRSEKSVHAISSDQVPANPYGYGMSAAQNNQVKNKEIPFCHNDQITESFADWMASEIVPDYMEKIHPQLSVQQKRYGYSNIWRGMCHQSSNGMPAGGMSPAGLDPHPAQDARTNNIILMQPKIRAQMNCPSAVPDRVYCSINTKMEAVPAENLNSIKPINQQGGVR